MGVELITPGVGGRRVGVRSKKLLQKILDKWRKA